MPCHPDRVRRNASPGVPTEIVERYKAGEREILVTPETFEAYVKSVVAIRRIVDHPTPDKIALVYKDAKVMK